MYQKAPVCLAVEIQKASAEPVVPISVNPLGQELLPPICLHAAPSQYSMVLVVESNRCLPASVPLHGVAPLLPTTTSPETSMLVFANEVPIPIFPPSAFSKMLFAAFTANVDDVIVIGAVV